MCLFIESRNKIKTHILSKSILKSITSISSRLTIYVANGASSYLSFFETQAFENGKLANKDGLARNDKEGTLMCMYAEVW